MTTPKRVNGSASSTKALPASPSTSRFANNRHDASMTPRKPLSMNGKRTADSSGSTSSSSPVCSRVEQIRRTKGVGYIGLNVSEQDLENWDRNDDRAIVWFDIDNTLYHKSTRIADLMGQRIHAYFLGLGLPDEEASALHAKYYREHGLAIRGLLKHHSGIDPLDYDRRVDGSLPLTDILKPEEELTKLIQDLDRSKCRVFALTNAYKTHGLRCIKLLGLEHLFDGILYCDYSAGPLFCCKPDVAYYEAASEIVGMKDVSKFHFVDDNVNNIRVAKELGWGSSVLYKEDDPPPVEGAVSQSGKADAGRPIDVGLLGANGASLDEAGARQHLRSLDGVTRLKLLDLLLDAALPGELPAMKESFERRTRSTEDVMSRLPTDVALRILEKLSVPELLRVRTLSQHWSHLTKVPTLWQSLAHSLTSADQRSIVSPAKEEDWEPFFRSLYRRERNWTRGLAQSVQLHPGHTSSVTAMRLRGQTLVTGSYDGTIRVWTLSSSDQLSCRSTIKAEKIACLDFAGSERQGVIAAGLYDSGRVLVFDVKSGQLMQTLSGHNKGVRNVAVNKDHLVSVGQDKTICVWDWRSGERVARFGQQSNVSLGVSLVGQDGLVAVSIDGVIRTFSIRGKKMIGEFHLSKLARTDPRWTKAIKRLNADGGTLSWFAADDATTTVASKTMTIHLEWPQHDGSLQPQESSTDSSAKGSIDSPTRSRFSNGMESPIKARSGSKPSSMTPSSPSTPISRSGSISSLRSSTASLSGSRLSSSTKDSKPSPSSSRAPTTPARSSKSLESPVTPSTYESSGDSVFGEVSNGLVANLAASPRIVNITQTSEVAIGAVNARKHRIVCSSRFSSRAGAEKALYISAYEDVKEAPGRESAAFIPLAGAWAAQASELSTAERNPTALAMGDESLVVGCSDGLVYRVGFVGDEYQAKKPASNGQHQADTTEVIGDATIDRLDELRKVNGWKDLFRQ